VDSKKLKISDVQRLASLGMNDAAPFSLEDVFAKTELAMRELKRADSSLPQRLKTVLMLIDGRTPYGSFARSLRAYGPVDELFMLLRDTGYIMHTGRTEFFSSTVSGEPPGVAMAIAKARQQPTPLPTSAGSSLLSKRQSVAEILGDPAHWELPVIPQSAPADLPAAQPAPRAAPAKIRATVIAVAPVAPTTVMPPVQALSPVPKVSTGRVVIAPPTAPALPTAPTAQRAPKAPSASTASLEPFVTQAQSPVSRALPKVAAVDTPKSVMPSLAAQSRALKLSADLLCDAVSEHAGFEGMELLLALERCVLIADLKALLPQAKALLEPAMGPAPLQSLMRRIDATLAL
jgi:hypothetical protein